MSQTQDHSTENQDSLLIQTVQSPSTWREIWSVIRHLPGWAMSAFLHGALLVLLAFWIYHPTPDNIVPLEISWSGKELIKPLAEQHEVTVENPSENVIQEFTESPAQVESVELATSNIDLELPEFSELPVSVPQKAETQTVNIFAGRTAAKRTSLALENGGTAESEKAVALGLKWLASHQQPRGGWSFDHTKCRGCRDRCSSSGVHPSTTGSTGLALLPFLGAGQTHQTGDYQETVRKGIYYLINSMKTGNRITGDLRGERGEMYCQGIATLALCELYAMTKDPLLKEPAQKALLFIVNAQDQEGGGWRYRPRQSGDTSVLGWQLMALKSGEMSYLKVPETSYDLASKFLDKVETDEGVYGYVSVAETTSSTHAIGLLSRMYLGWKQDHPILIKGKESLSKTGPLVQDMYFNYYATQILHHLGGSEWTEWNQVMRDYLVKTQVQEGHATGSWNHDDRHLKIGGRLYVTSLSLMILEVYYRHMPLYETFEVETN